jgi:hypothetical protein
MSEKFWKIVSKFFCINNRLIRVWLEIFDAVQRGVVYCGEKDDFSCIRKPASEVRNTKWRRAELGFSLQLLILSELIGM